MTTGSPPHNHLDVDTESHMDSLPDEMLLAVFTNSQTADLLSLACVSRRFHQLATALISYKLELGYDSVLSSDDESCVSKRINTRAMSRYLDDGVFDVKFACYLRRLVLYPHPTWVPYLRELLEIIKERNLHSNITRVDVNGLDLSHRKSIKFMQSVEKEYDNGGTEFNLTALVRPPVVNQEPLVLGKINNLNLTLSTDEMEVIIADDEEEEQDEDEDEDEDDWGDDTPEFDNNFDFILDLIQLDHAATDVVRCTAGESEGEVCTFTRAKLAQFEAKYSVRVEMGDGVSVLD